MYANLIHFYKPPKPLSETAGRFGCVVPPGVWHTVEVLEPSVIFEVKAGKYGEDGSEMF